MRSTVLSLALATLACLVSASAFAATQAAPHLTINLVGPQHSGAAQVYEVKFEDARGKIVFTATATTVPGAATPVSIENDTSYLSGIKHSSAYTRIINKKPVHFPATTELETASVKQGAWLDLLPDASNSVVVDFKVVHLDAMNTFTMPGTSDAVQLPQVSTTEVNQTLHLVPGASAIIPMGRDAAAGRLIVTRTGAAQARSVVISPTGVTHRTAAYLASLTSTPRGYDLKVGYTGQ